MPCSIEDPDLNVKLNLSVTNGRIGGRTDRWTKRYIPSPISLGGGIINGFIKYCIRSEGPGPPQQASFFTSVTDTMATENLSSSPRLKNRRSGCEVTLIPFNFSQVT